MCGRVGEVLLEVAKLVAAEQVQLVVRTRREKAWHEDHDERRDVKGQRDEFQQRGDELI